MAKIDKGVKVDPFNEEIFLPEVCLDANLTEQIREKLVEMQTRPLEIRKSFGFNVEKLQDDPESCLKEIEEYLEQHKDKIKDYWFQSYIDENTFRPILVMNIVPSSYWQGMMQKNTLFENMLSDEWKKNLIGRRVHEVMEKYLYEMNTPETRQLIARDIEKIIFALDKRHLSVIDSTSPEEVDAGTFKFKVKDGETETDLVEYIVSVSDKK